MFSAQRVFTNSGLATLSAVGCKTHQRVVLGPELGDHYLTGPKIPTQAVTRDSSSDLDSD